MIWNPTKFVAFDVETSGTQPEYALQPWRVDTNEAWLTSMAIIEHNGSTLVANGSKLAPTPADVRAFLHRAIDEDLFVVAWYATFDIAWCVAYGCADLVHKVRWLDGMLLWRHLSIEPEYDTDRGKRKSYSLKAAVPEFLPVEHHNYSDEIDFHDESPAARAKLLAYNNRDAVYTWVLAHQLWHELTPRQLNAALIEASCLSLVAEANYFGMPVDTLACRSLTAKLDDTAARMLVILAPHGVTEKIVRSPLKLAKLMYDDWKLPVLKENVGAKTGKISRATDKEVLHELAFMDPRCADLRSYREALGNKTKFADAPLAAAAYNGDGRARPSAIVFGTYTGRMTYSSKQGRGVNELQTGFALHQEKRGREFRSIIVPPPGYALMEVDAGGQEFRWMAILSGDTTMKQLCLPGEDMHSYMGASIVGVAYREMVAAFKAEDKDAEQNRYLGKVANLCIAEGTTVLTDRGPCNIEQVCADDLVWDGERFVAHAGVSFSGVREVISYAGITGTPDHKVLVDGMWVELQGASRYGWRIEPALGAGRTSTGRAALRIVGGLVGRAIREIWGAVYESALRLWSGEGRQLAYDGSRSINMLQGLRDPGATRAGRRVHLQDTTRQAIAGESERMVSALSQSRGQVVSQLWRAWDRVQVLIRQGGRRVPQGALTASNVPETGHRPDQQRWPLRAWKLALGYAQGEPGQSRQVRTYDIVNCGPNTRFAANGLIVHNSLQYRTYPKTFCKVARVQYNIPMELPTAQRIHTTYKQTYRDVPRYWENQIRKTRALGYVETLAGRRVNVVGNWEGSLAWKMESTSLNYPVQGTGGDQKYLAMRVLKDYLPTIGAFFAWDLHDGIYMYVPEDMVERAAADIRQLLDNLPYREAWDFTPDIPLPWDVKSGFSWGTLKEIKHG